MPSDLNSSSRRAPTSRPSSPTNPISIPKLIILLILTIFYSLIAIHNNYPPYNWIDKYLKRNELPKAAKGFARYSNEHRYRPAASPIIKKVGKNGKVELHGLYHD